MPTTRGMGDLAPQSEREHNYVVMFRNSPKSAALVFSRLFRSKDSTLLNFMDAFPWTRPGMKQQEQLWSSGFPIVLLEALTDNRWYESFKVNCGKFAGDDTSNSETREFGQTLRCLWCFMKNVDTKAPKYTAVLQECLQRFPAMWRLLWSYRDVMLLCPEDSEARGNLQHIAELLECYTAIHQTQHTGRAPPLESYAGHIALHFLIFPHDFRIYSIRHPACILWDIIETEGKDGFLREHSFLYEAFPAAVRFGGSEDHNIGGFYMIIILNLISNRPTRSSELRCTLNVLGLLLLWGPSILSYPATKFNQELYTIAMTAQQYGCLGWLDDDRKPGYESPDIARAFLTYYTGIIENVRNGSDQKLVGNIAEAPDWFGMVNIVAQSAVAVYEENDAAGKVIIERFLKCYNNIAMVGKSAYHTNRRRWHAYCYLRRMLQVYWLPTLNDLRTTMHGTPAQRTHRSAAVRASLHSLYKQWINLGQTFNLSQISREDDTGLTDYVTAKELRSGCYFSECLCYGKKPLKRPRRICKGCWSVYYCGQRCQEKDWKAGHRDVCWGRHSSANKPQ